MIKKMPSEVEGAFVAELRWTNSAWSAFFDCAAHFVSRVHHRGQILPVTINGLAGMSGWMLGMRNSMIGVLSEDYVTMAETSSWIFFTRGSTRVYEPVKNLSLNLPGLGRPGRFCVV